MAITGPQDSATVTGTCQFPSARPLIMGPWGKTVIHFFSPVIIQTVTKEKVVSRRLPVHDFWVLQGSFLRALNLG